MHIHFSACLVRPFQRWWDSQDFSSSAENGEEGMGAGKEGLGELEGLRGLNTQIAKLVVRFWY